MPGDDNGLYEPLYEHMGANDPVRKLATAIQYSGVESRQLFSGYRGSGKSTELFRLKKMLEEDGYLVYYANALDYMNPALAVDVTDFLIFLAGAFGESVKKVEGIDLTGESYWERFRNYLENTTIKFEKIDFTAFKNIATFKAAIKEEPSFRQQLKSAMSLRLSELVAQVRRFFEDCKKRLDELHTNSGIVFLFDNLEQLRGVALNEKQEVITSVRNLFSQHLDSLNIPYFHLVYTAPPWLRFAISGIGMEILPSIVQWKGDADHTPVHEGDKALLNVIKRRFGPGGFQEFFGSDEAALPIVRSCGGSLRDLLFLVRDTILVADELPISSEVVGKVIQRLANSLVLMSTDDALWLAQVAKTHNPELPNRSDEKISEFTVFVDARQVLFLRNSKEWYDVHPLIREHVEKTAQREAEKAGAGSESGE